MDEGRHGVRARRSGWAKGRRLTQTERDLDILSLVGLCGIVRTRDILRMFFGARATANDRLRKLFVAGLLECFAPDLAGDNYYALTPLGREAVLDAVELDPESVRVVRKLPKKLDHTLSITDVRLHLALACRRDPRYEVLDFLTDADLARARHAALLDLVPDAKVTLADKATGERHVVFLEADLGTESLTWLVRKKLGAYDRHAALGTALYGVRNPPVLLVTTGLRRARNIARALERERLCPTLAVALWGALNETTVLGSTYALAADLLGAAADATPEQVFTRRLLP